MLVRPPFLIRKFYSKLTWQIPGDNNVVYLTFDDGPIPGVTEFVLDTLKQFKIKATFFCIGDNVSKHPEIYNRILSEVHQTGNHTYHHLNGWKTDFDLYIDNVFKAEKIIASNLFRPPYGRIRKAQAGALLPQFKIIMWDVLSYDYDKKVSKEKCYENIISNTRPGSIIVFHDSIKAFENLKYALPKCIEELQRKGFAFEVIPS